MLTMADECRLLVLAPFASDIKKAEAYQPFGKKRLIDIINEVAIEMRGRRRRRRYDRHEVFGGFFFGSAFPDPELQDELRDEVPTSLLDCRVYYSGEPQAAEAALSALADFVDGPGGSDKLIVFICTHGCQARRLDVLRARSDDMLHAHLSSDLRGSNFKRIGRLMDGG